MWTDERVEMLKKLWAEGLSASQVAKQLGGVTRNAVIGKVHRLGLSGRSTPSRAPRPRTASMRPSEPRLRMPSMATSPEDADHSLKAERAAKERIEEPVLDPSQRATVLTLTDHTCKWPIGDPGHPGFHFCGRKADAGSPYCMDHARLAYQPVQPRRSRDKDRERLRYRDGLAG